MFQDACHVSCSGAREVWVSGERGEGWPGHSVHSMNLGPPRNRCQDNKDFTRETAQETNGVEVGRRGWGEHRTLNRGKRGERKV